MSRRLLMLCVFALLAQLGTGCYHIRQRIAWRWHNFHCGACCTPCTPAFRIPSPAPIIGSPVGCPTCYSSNGEVPVSAPVIVPGSAPGHGGPVITSPTPLGSGPMVIPMQPGIPSPLPSKPGN